MQISDEIRLEAPRRKVYAALNDLQILKQAIPGCEEIEQVSETELTATVALKIGPIKARFKGKVMLSDLNPPESYTISGEGSGGAAGFAKGSAKVSLVEDGGARRPWRKHAARCRDRSPVRRSPCRWHDAATSSTRCAPGGRRTCR